MDKESREIAMYGCTEASIKKTAEAYMDRVHASPVMLAIAMLNQVQNQIDLKTTEDAKKTLNQVKWVLKNYVLDDE